MEKILIKSLIPGHKITSTYAELYLGTNFCDNDLTNINLSTSPEPQSQEKIMVSKEGAADTSCWKSPSDALIGNIQLKPPFTSKVFRGETHEGIANIGKGIIDEERKKFMKTVQQLLLDNDNSWRHILDLEKENVKERVRSIYQNILDEKCQVMTKEMSLFYEKSLQELEINMHNEIQKILESVNAQMINQLNTDIESKLAKEKKKLDSLLKKIHKREYKKAKEYYKLLLDNELKRHDIYLRDATEERNDAVRAFCRQSEAETFTSTMFILSTARKKCLIEKIVLQNYQANEIKQKLTKLRQQKDLIEHYKSKDVPITYINKEWRDEITKIVELFTKFINYSLKLLPEQSKFLLDMKQILIMQMNQLQNAPKDMPLVLMERESLQNLFRFSEMDPSENENICEKEPMVVTGDLSDIVTPYINSRETLDSDVSLPIIRVQRQFIYARCHGFENIKSTLESERCKCEDILVPDSPPPEKNTEIPPAPTPVVSPSESKTTQRSLFLGDFDRLKECPGRKCADWLKSNSFPYLNNYIDYSEENYKRVKTLLGRQKPTKVEQKTCTRILAKEIAHQDLLFKATKEPFHTVATQYSQQESIASSTKCCVCTKSVVAPRSQSHYHLSENDSHNLNDVLTKRRHSINRLIQEHPKILQMFTDECFDFQL